MLLVANLFNDCFFLIDENGKYITGDQRDQAIALLIAYNVLMAVFVLVKALRSRDSLRRRGMMAFLFCITIAVAITLQIIWPLTPFTALGCLISNCFFHVFVIQDEQAAKHAAELEDALEHVHAAEKARSMFFSIVSHDIRTPLNAILGYCELLQGGFKTEAERKEALDSIRASGTTLLQLVNDVLDLAKIDAGMINLQLEPVRLSQLIDEVFASFRLAVAEKGIELVNRTADVPTVLLDGHRFRRILFNLVGNAVKFTERGSVTVSASFAGGNLDVAVSDTGCGIPSDMVARILDPFVQVQDPRHAADRANGTGLGLSICQNLVKTMGGELVVESEPGKGSTFKVRIPTEEASAENPPATTEPAPPASAEPAEDGPSLPKRVLVVDDSPVNRVVLTAFLKKAGITGSSQARDGLEAFAELDSAMKGGNPYDFVFSDFWMPNMNGLELIEKLRADPRFRDLPVFAVTADTELQHDDRSKLFSGVLLKPITYDKLMETFAVKQGAAVTE